jgi:hypothetical protein
MCDYSLALEFPNGEFVLLTRLYEGQLATVLQLPATPRGTEESEQTAGVVGRLMAHHMGATL